MLDIILLIILAIQIGKLARRKGLKPGLWRLYLVLGWLALELVGVIIGILIFGQDNLFSVVLVGIGFAITSYFLIKAHLEKLPDHDYDDEINNIGN
jgi:hypothetical protein